MKRNLIAVCVAALVAGLVANATAYDVKPGKGGTIKGKAVFKGDAGKANQKIKPDKDTDMCPEHTDAPTMVGEGGALANAVIYLKKIDAGKDWPESMKKCEIDNSKCQFAPNVSFVMKGGEIVFKNSDPKLHNIKATSTNYNFNEGVEGGKTLTKKADKKDTVNLACSVHPWMNGTLWVVDHPYYVATNDKGEYTLSDVPAGKYTVVAKHAKFKAKEAKGADVEVKEGADASLDFEFGE